jgi:hypothetical protein
VGDLFVGEYAAGDGQLIVIYVNKDRGSGINPDDLMRAVAEDAGRRLADGWRLQSLGSLPLRQMGTAGNFLFQSGGQFTTEAVIVAVFSR